MFKTNDFWLLVIVAVLGFIVYLSLIACGQQGSRGATGSPGTPAPISEPISILTQPATSQECSNGGTVLSIGATVSIVCNGSTGSTGATGASGSTGLNGVDTTPVTIVQLCQGVTPQYPSTFPEIAVCLGSQLYAVYSQNGGFLVLLTPGQYSSNGINASCTFTVGLNCQISQ